MRKILILIFVLLILFPAGTRAQGLDCAHASPICFDSNYASVTYPAPLNAPSAETGLSYGCLYSQPNPSWFFFMVTSPGDIQLRILGENDVDFACWGPIQHPLFNCQASLFDNFNTPSHDLEGPSADYPSGNLVDCSYSASSNEWCYIPNAAAGEYYILLVTNFSNSETSFTIQRSDYATDSPGQINCIFPSDTIDTYVINVCQHDTVVLHSQVFDSASYFWYGPHNYFSNDSILILADIQTSDSGVYKNLVITDSMVIFSTYDVQVDFIPQSAYSAASNVFGDGYFHIYYVADSNILYYGDGDSTVSVESSTTYIHPYDSAGTYDVSLITFAECGSDTNAVHMNVTFASVPLISPDAITLAPNPTTGICRIDGLQGEEISLIQIQSADGRLLLSEKPDPSRTFIDLSPFSPGVYFLTVQTKSEMYRARILRISGQ